LKPASTPFSPTGCAASRRTILAFAINCRARAREDCQKHAGVLAAVIAGDSALAALLANRHSTRRRGLRRLP